MSRMKWCVYLMVADDGQGFSFCKIGMTSDLGCRIGQVQVGCPVPITEVAYLPMRGSSSARAAERVFHQHLAAFNSQGEWFRLNLADPAHKAIFHEATKRALTWSAGDLSEVKWKRVSIEAVRFATKALRLDEAA